MPVQQLAIAFLVALAVGGIAWVFLYPLLTGEKRAEKRKEALTKGDGVRAANAVLQSGKNRREKVEESLKELERKQQASGRLPLNIRLQQAGLKWTKQRFYLTCAGFAAMLGLVAFSVSGSWILALLLVFVGGLGFPFWILHFLKARRQKKFINIFPDAVDVIVRGIKAGLPLLDCMKMIASEASEPVASEFRAVTERQAIGTPLGDACGLLYERTGLTEANFFAIVIMIQQRAGGNLSEALGNLSRVLRDRKKMRAKIQAMSMEAKASAGIIGSLPAIVALLVYLTSPEYITILFTDNVGRVLLLISAFWMSCGIFTMRKMINFDF